MQIQLYTSIMIKWNIRKVFYYFRRMLISPSLRHISEFDVGVHTYGDPEIHKWGKNGSLTVGSYCSIANSVTFLLDGNHCVNWVTTHTFPTLKGNPHLQDYFVTEKCKIVVGNDVWIGMGAMILPGVTIGDGAIIGARAVVTKSVPAYAVAVGNPAKVVKYRFAEEVIEDLLHIQWWNWPEDRIREMLPYLLQDDIDEFVRRAKDAT